MKWFLILFSFLSLNAYSMPGEGRASREGGRGQRVERPSSSVEPRSEKSAASSEIEELIKAPSESAPSINLVRRTSFGNSQQNGVIQTPFAMTAPTDAFKIRQPTVSSDTEAYSALELAGLFEAEPPIALQQQPAYIFPSQLMQFPSVIPRPQASIVLAPHQSGEALISRGGLFSGDVFGGVTYPEPAMASNLRVVSAQPEVVAFPGLVQTNAAVSP